MSLTALIASVALSMGGATATRIGPDQYRIEGTDREVLTRGCTHSAVRHPIRITGPDERGRNWLYFINEGDPCLIIVTR